MVINPYVNYIAFIEDNYLIVDKQGTEVQFELNAIQKRFAGIATGRDLILKARQQGFSSFILAVFATDFITKENSRSVIVADKSENAMELLERVKGYIKSYEAINGVKVPLKYNSKYELANDSINSKYTIGTAENTEFGRSKTITNLHLSEAAFYPKLSKLLAGALQAVVPNGKVVIETTANGFNDLKTFYDNSVLFDTGFMAHFYKASDFYDTAFLAKKAAELGRQFQQEYPESAEEAFITSGDTYFQKDSLYFYLQQVKAWEERKRNGPLLQTV